MKRQRVNRTAANHVYVDTPSDEADSFSLNETKSSQIGRWMEAEILPGDTLQAVALRFNCTIAELKKINKIDKDNEIFAKRIIRVPITPHSILLETLPKVHSSGNSSPKNVPAAPLLSSSTLEEQIDLDEKLIVAAVSNASYNHQQTHQHLKPFHDDPLEGSSHEIFSNSDGIDAANIRQSLLSGEYDESIPQPRPVRLPANDFSCNGSDCDMSWICLLVCILALCFAIPMIYVFYVAEHTILHHDNVTGITTIHSKL
ncbi:lysM and putative peptidoglycan-binding domain-containing protein 3 [Uranotaenia lowii]|uniref:lysM and putative peptidoglycan-binding domain-containing protein 3 n=1 Tax=Uranotaenia lowii TaxID=190385 RepID=UPI002479465C|nr:lysM and putative peptidoglycan-binding domain-containing protein 3 [Uranotaenia lowii]